MEASPTNDTLAWEEFEGALEKEAEGWTDALVEEMRGEPPKEQITEGATRTSDARLVKAIRDNYINVKELDDVRIEFTDLGAVHGQYEPENNTITLNPSIFESDEIFGEESEQKIDRATHTIVHEYAHALAYRHNLDQDPKWLALSAWKHSADVTPPGMSRYVERRSGWPQGPSDWVYDDTTWFPRSYSAKSPAEDFADCALWYLVGWMDRFANGGEGKREYVRACF